MELIIRRFDINSFETYTDQVYQFHEIDNLFESSSNNTRPSLNDIIFLTGNKNKLIELEQNLQLPKRLKMSTMSIDLAEIQHSDPLAIVQDKCLRAYEHINKLSESISRGNCAILIEDTSLMFRALGGLPGPYVKYFLNAIGPDGLTKMLTGFDDKFSEAHCIYALMPIFKLAAATPEYSGKEIVFFRGIARGLIVSPRGSLGWGWDPVFEEERSQLTFGEMDASMKSRFSHRANALTILKKYLEKI